MKFSEHTLAVLKNFASINPGMVMVPGKVQKTLHPDSVILAEATLEDDFPIKFGVYDLNQFLGNITTLNDPDLDFSPEYVVMKEGDFEMTYHTCAHNLITSPPEGQKLVMDNADVSFVITSAGLQKLLKLAAMNSLPIITVQGRDGGLYFKTHELKSDTSNFASLRVGDHAGEDFSASFKTENLRMIPDDYTVKIKIGEFSCWENKAGTLKYFIGLEKVKK